MCGSPLPEGKLKFCSTECNKTASSIIRDGLGNCCKECGRVFEFTNKRGKKREFCHHNCNARYNRRRRKIEERKTQTANPINPYYLRRGNTMQRSGSTIEAGWIG